MSHPPSPPVTPRVATLPFSDIPWERFEQFGHDMLLAMPGVRPETAHRYGTQGQKQRGIDLTVERTDGKRWAFSNKRYEEYQPNDVRKHIGETTYKADRYVLLISGIASTSVRDEVRKHRKWELWDAEDISQRVRLELQREVARRLVDHHFGPVWRRDFLGLPAVGAFLPLADHFRHLLDDARLFHHAIPLVGRQALLDDLAAFADSPLERILVLPGRGGIGKSRLLLEWARRFDATHSDRAVRLLNEGVPLSLEALDDLPPVPCVVAVDDAHRRTDLGPLLAWLRQRTDTKLLLAARPQGLDFLLSELTRAGFDSLQIRRLPPVEKLSRAEVRQLSAHVLGPDRGDLVEPLVRATRDCPLVTVVGGRLLAIRSVHPELLERDGDFRQEVLTKFTDESLGQVSRSVPADLARRVLQLVAALAPVPADPGPFHDRMATFLKADATDTTQALGELERVGLLARRVRSLRVVPDVLADHVVASACLTPQGAATGFADRVFGAFAGDCLPQLLRNLAELDWRVRVDSGADSPLLDRVWGQIREGFRSGGHRVRADVLGQLKDSAYFLPGRVLELVRFALRNPAGGPEEVFGLLNYTHENVVRAAPEVIRRCSYTENTVGGCLDLLWEIGRGDGRPTNSYPEHPFRILTEIAAYDPDDKPLWVQRAALDAARRWLRRPDAFAGPHTPLDALAPLLQKSGTVCEAGEGRTIRMRAFHLRYCPPVSDFRAEVLDAVGGCLGVADLRVVLQAVRILGGGLKKPVPYLNASFTDDDLAQWEPEQMRILEMLARLATDRSHPVVLLAVFRETRLAARYDHSPRVRDRAAALVAGIGQDFEFRVTRMLLPELSRWDLFLEEPGDDPVGSRQNLYQTLGREVAAEFWVRHPDPTEVAAEIDRRLREVVALGVKCEAAGLVHHLLEARPEAVTPLLRRLTLLPGSPAVSAFPMGLAHLHACDPGGFVQIAGQAVATGDLGLRRAVAHHFAWDVGHQTALAAGELDVICSLLADADAAVRSAALGALRRVASLDSRLALDLARGVDAGGDPAVVAELCRLADPSWQGCPAAFTDDDVVTFLNAVEGLDDIGQEVVPFLGFACGRVPQAVIDMFLRRVERQRREGYRSEFRPVPFGDMEGTFSGLPDEARRAALRHLRDHSLVELPDFGSLSDLYRDVSAGYGPAGVDVLSEWLLGDRRDRMEAAAALLRRAPSGFVFDHLDLVCRVLDHAVAFGDDCEEALGGCFHGIATGGVRSWGGGPAPQDLALRDRCQEALARLPPSGGGRRLISSVLERAERNIRAAAAEIEDDGEE